MMTTRRVDELPETDAAPIFELVERARAAANTGVTNTGPWAAAEAGQQSIRTGYKAARRVASAGQYAAHALRLTVLDVDEPQPWQQVLASDATAAAISSWDWDQRMYAALALRATFKDLPAGERASALPAQLVAAWLTHNSGPKLPGATARLCAYVLGHVDEATLSAAWYATHGLRLVDELAAPPRLGQPPRADAERRDQLRAAVRGLAASRTTTKSAIAAAAGITRATLDAWLVSEAAETIDQDVQTGERP